MGQLRCFSDLARQLVKRYRNVMSMRLTVKGRTRIATLIDEAPSEAVILNPLVYQRPALRDRYAQLQRNSAVMRNEDL